MNYPDTFGYCLLEACIPQASVKSIGKRFIELHTDPNYQAYITGNQYYQTLFGILHQDERVWNCASHPGPLEIAQHFLGLNCHAVEACSKIFWPNAPPQRLHFDSAEEFLFVPDVTWMLNTICILRDFTEENGSTGLVPLIHRSRLKKPSKMTSTENRPHNQTSARTLNLCPPLEWQPVPPRPVNVSDQIGVGLDNSLLPSLV